MTTPDLPARGGRGARDRILQAAARLFYRQGIHATGVAAITKAAHVSTRTFYQHFESKTALIEAYVRRYETDAPLHAERQINRDDLPPVERLLAIFDLPTPGSVALVRGCPLHNAAVEAAGELPGVAHQVERHKQAFRERLVAVAAEAGAADPESLGSQIALLYEGATALATSINDITVTIDARRAAATLIQAALATASVG